MIKYWIEIILITAILVGMGICLCRAEESKQWPDNITRRCRCEEV